MGLQACVEVIKDPAFVQDLLHQKAHQCSGTDGQYEDWCCLAKGQDQPLHTQINNRRQHRKSGVA